MLIADILRIRYHRSLEHLCKPLQIQASPSVLKRLAMKSTINATVTAVEQDLEMAITSLTVSHPRGSYHSNGRLDLLPKTHLQSENQNLICKMLGSDILAGQRSELEATINCHNKEEIELIKERLATHVAFLDEGRLLFQGTLDELRGHSREVFLQTGHMRAGVTPGNHASLRTIFVSMVSAARAAR